MKWTSCSTLKLQFNGYLSWRSESQAHSWGLEPIWTVVVYVVPEDKADWCKGWKFKCLYQHFSDISKYPVPPEGIVCTDVLLCLWICERNIYGEAECVVHGEWQIKIEALKAINKSNRPLVVVRALMENPEYAVGKWSSAIAGGCSREYLFHLTTDDMLLHWIGCM